MSAEILRQIVKGNSETFAATHQPSPKFSDFPDTKAALLISCMDPRSNPNAFLGLEEQHGVAVIRNGGGRVGDDTLRSLRLLAGVMSNGKNTLGVVGVIHHTDCGLSNFSNEKIAELLKVRAELDGARAKEVDGLDFGSWSHQTPEESVKQDIQIIKNDPYLPKSLEVLGFVYDVFTGKTTEVV